MKKETTIRISEKAHKRLKAQAKKSGRTLKSHIDFLAGVIHN